MKLSRRVVYWMHRFEDAVRDMAFLGSKSPEERVYVEEEYHRAKEKLIDAIREEA